MKEHWVEILVAIIGLLAGMTIVVRIVVKNRSKRVTQKGNIVGGDQAGGDIHKR